MSGESVCVPFHINQILLSSPTPYETFRYEESMGSWQVVNISSIDLCRGIRNYGRLPLYRRNCTVSYYYLEFVVNWKHQMEVLLLVHAKKKSNQPILNIRELKNIQIPSNFQKHKFNFNLSPNLTESNTH